MTSPRWSRWFKGLLAFGALLAVALLAQTVVNYRYITDSLIRQEARRVAEERVRGFERAVRVARGPDAEAYERLLDDYRNDIAEQVPAITVVRFDGSVVSSSGASMVLFDADARRAFLNSRTAPMSAVKVDGQSAFVGVFPCRCAPATAAAMRPEFPDRVFLQVAVLRDSLSRPFARLRRDAMVSASAAIALLMAVGLITIQLGPYVRGKQIQDQLRLAREVQRALLPAPTAWPRNVDAAAACVPASQVGGDFYDVQDLGDGALTFSIGDVSGHGISAALLMSMMHGAMGSSRDRGTDGPEPLATRLNELLLTKSSGERFASMIACWFDPRTARLLYVNAGHPPGLLIRGADDEPQQVMRLAAGGPVLGVLRDAVYRNAILDVRDGDLLVLFSDGIVEATNGDDEYFGEGRLLDAIERHKHLPADAISAAVLSAVEAFTGRRPAQDDRTVLVIRLWHASADRAPAA